MSNTSGFSISPVSENIEAAPTKIFHVAMVKTEEIPMSLPF